MSKQTIQLYEARTRAAGTKKRHWRSIEELANTAEFQEAVSREFPRQAGELRDPVTRRSFLKLMGASLALAGVTTGCEYNLQQPSEKIVPYVRLPEGLIPGKPLFFATAMPFQGYGLGVVVEQYEGRPTKVEGNPDHPATQGGSDIFMQASVLTMYDPDRSKAIRNIKAPDNDSTWADFTGALAPALTQQRGSQGQGMRLLTETVTSPTLIAQIQQLQQAFPQMKWVQYDPISRDNVRAGTQLAFGSIVEPTYNFADVQVVVSLDSDFMTTEPGHLRYARDFAQTRKVRHDKQTMSRFYVAESTPSVTSTISDHRLPVRSSRIETLARALATQSGVPGVTGGEGLTEQETAWVAAIAADLKAAGGASIVIAGEQQPAVVHALAHAINSQLGSVGKTVQYIEPLEANPAVQIDNLRQLATDMNSGAVQLLLMLDGNPAYDAPADLNFAAALEKVPLSVHYSLFNDETSLKSTWHVNATHYLEMWSDVRAYDGTASIVQPLIAPLYGARSPHELLETLLSQNPRTGHDVVRGYWQSQTTGGTFDDVWQTALRVGTLPNTAAQPRQVALQTGFAGQAAAAAPAGLELSIRPDPSVWDGRFANNGWLQELPNPFTKLTWDNAAYISPRRAAELQVEEGDVIQLAYDSKTLQVPVIPLPGQADETVTVHLGYGRTPTLGVISAPTGEVIGYNAYALRTSAAPWFNGGVQITKTGQRHELVTTRNNYVIDEQVYDAAERRELVHVATLEEYKRNPNFAHTSAQSEAAPSEGHSTEGENPGAGNPSAAGEGKQDTAQNAHITLLPNFPYRGYAWGMSIDMNACIGCNACITACQSENNIAVVGKEQVAMGREMFWIRIDQYYRGDLNSPDISNQPLLCMQCESAPCELVCPVAATVHDAEGLNNMIYNRCVGTKYCSNNCPYKVRRFNFFQYQDESTPSLKLQRNPNVTVRARGVMEKCTYCVQRINATRQDTEQEGRAIRDGEVLTACQQACPTTAIIFGNINDTESQVAKLKAEPTNYSLLEELNTRPRTTYLARVRNPNATLGEI